MVTQQHYQLSSIRQLISKRYLTDSDIQKLIDIIQKSHISVFKSLSKFFVSLRNQLVHSDSILKKTFNIKKKDYQFKSSYLRCKQKMLANLADIINSKICLYAENPQKQSINVQIHKQFEINERQKIVSHFYPEAFFLQKTIRNQLSFMKKFYQTKPNKIQNKENHFPKDKLALNLQSKLKEYQNVVNSTFSKQSFYESEPIKFTHEEFYTIKEHYQKFNYYLQPNRTQLTEKYRNSQLIEQIHNLTPISAKCVGCVPFLYKNHKLPRQRCSLMNFQVLNTLDDRRDHARFKQLVQTFINTKNGGIIFFDCHDLFFSIKPKGFECSLKVFQQKKQSLIDICKNLFSDLKINRQFYIDFVLLKDIDVLLNRKNRKQQSKDTQIIGRFRILKEKVNTIVEQKDQTGKKQITYQNICMNHYIKKLDKQELMKLQIQREIFSDTGKFQEILKKIQNQDNNQMLAYLQGRQGPLVRHEGRNCKQKPLQIYDDRLRKKQKNAESNEKIVLKQQITQRFEIGKEPLHFTDKNVSNWSLLVVNILEIQKIELQMNTCIDNKSVNFEIQAPFQDYDFFQSKKTILIKTSFSHQQFVSIINSQEAQQNKYFRTYKKQTGFVPLLHIKVYDYIYVSFVKKITQIELNLMRKQLQSEVKNYFQKKFRVSENIQKNLKYLEWIKQLQIKIYSHQTRPSIYVTTNDWNPSYALLFIYYKFKHESSTKKETTLKKIELKQHKDFSNQNGYRLINMN